MDSKEGKIIIFPLAFLFKENAKVAYTFLRKKVFKPYLKIFCMKAIIFYQKHLSRHTCKYNPTCSQYTLESINNRGVILGILLGLWRILRCNPFSRGGFDPASENPWKKRWLL